MAVLFAILLIAPFTLPSVPLHLAAVSAFPEAVVAPGDQGKHPAAALRPGPPATVGILSRLSLVETAFGLSPAKPPLLRPVADQLLLAPSATAAPGGEPRAVFERSAVGTARTPTGPPS